MLLTADTVLDIVTNQTGFMSDAACAEHPELRWNFFEARDGSPAQQLAIDCCNRYLVRTECLACAVERHIEFGLWGGKSWKQRLADRRTAVATRRSLRPMRSHAATETTIGRRSFPF
jgi:hypothetical protein